MDGQLHPFATGANQGSVAISHEDDTGEVEVDMGETDAQPHYFEVHYTTGRLPYVYIEVGGVKVIEGYVTPGIPPRRQKGRKRWRS